MTHRIHDHAAPAAASSLSDDQFDELVDLLKPIHDLAVALLADRAAADGAKREPETQD